MLKKKYVCDLCGEEIDKSYCEVFCKGGNK